MASLYTKVTYVVDFCNVDTELTCIFAVCVNVFRTTVCVKRRDASGSVGWDL